MRYQYLRLHAPEAQPERPRETQDSVSCPASSNPYPDYEGSTIFEDDEEKENSHVIIIQL